MVHCRFDDQDCFEVDPVRYADALGELGLAAYRRDVKQRIEEPLSGALVPGEVIALATRHVTVRPSGHRVVTRRS